MDQSTCRLQSSYCGPLVWHTLESSVLFPFARRPFFVRSFASHQVPDLRVHCIMQASDHVTLLPILQLMCRTTVAVLPSPCPLRPPFGCSKQSAMRSQSNYPCSACQYVLAVLTHLVCKALGMCRDCNCTCHPHIAWCASPQVTWTCCPAWSASSCCLARPGAGCIAASAGWQSMLSIARLCG